MTINKRTNERVSRLQLLRRDVDATRTVVKGEGRLIKFSVERPPARPTDRFGDGGGG